jgi:hypothetical protein
MYREEYKMIGAILGKDLGVSNKEYLIILPQKDYDDLIKKELELSNLKEFVREYLKFNSKDGNRIRQQMRLELEKLCR